MLSEGFLYRRLARLVPCALRNVAGGSLFLRNKWQVSSLRDVFLSSHYWRIFEHLETRPSLIVDLGGHCGHFVILSELILEERFGRGDARYLVVEGLAELVDNIHRTLSDTGLRSRCRVVHGLAGRRTGSAELRSSRSNLLESSVVSEVGTARGQEVPYVDLLDYIPENGRIDILKVDIEGSEYELIETYPKLFQRAALVAMEIHTVAGHSVSEIFEALESFGLRPCLPHITKGPNLLVLFKRTEGL